MNAQIPDLPPNGSPEETPDLPGSLKLLRGMVMVLTAVMIGGVVTVVALLVMRLGAEPPAMPPDITLPEGMRAVAVTQGRDWVAVVTETADGAQSILVFDPLTGAIQQDVPILSTSSD